MALPLANPDSVLAFWFPADVLAGGGGGSGVGNLAAASGPKLAHFCFEGLDLALYGVAWDQSKRCQMCISQRICKCAQQMHQTCSVLQACSTKNVDLGPQQCTFCQGACAASSCAWCQIPNSVCMHHDKSCKCINLWAAIERPADLWCESGATL